MGETPQFYRSNAEADAWREITSHQARLTALLTLLSPKAKILELGPAPAATRTSSKGSCHESF